jgi:hypothetical protein
MLTQSRGDRDLSTPANVSRDRGTPGVHRIDIVAVHGVGGNVMGGNNQKRAEQQHKSQTDAYGMFNECLFHSSLTLAAGSVRNTELGILRDRSAI